MQIQVNFKDSKWNIDITNIVDLKDIISHIENKLNIQKQTFELFVNNIVNNTLDRITCIEQIIQNHKQCTEINKIPEIQILKIHQHKKTSSLIQTAQNIHNSINCPILQEKAVIAQKNAIVHKNISCNGCGQDSIKGARFSCIVCPSFNLCETCENNNEHEHPLLKIKKCEKQLQLIDEVENIQEEEELGNNQNHQELCQQSSIESVKIDNQQELVLENQSLENQIQEIQIQDLNNSFQHQQIKNSPYDIENNLNNINQDIDQQVNSNNDKKIHNQIKLFSPFQNQQNLLVPQNLSGVSQQINQVFLKSSYQQNQNYQQNVFSVSNTISLKTRANSSNSSVEKNSSEKYYEGYEFSQTFPQYLAECQKSKVKAW